MIDNDDVQWIAINSPGSDTPWWLHLLWLVGFVCIWWAACSNEDDCSKRHCDHGEPVLTRHECRCLEKAK